MELCIDTSTRWASIAISHEGTLISGMSWYSKQNHTVELAPAVASLLNELNLKTQNLDGLVIAVGPGNFSALRVGLGFVKGIAWACQIPVVPLSTLELEAHPYLKSERPVCPILDVGRGEIAWALFEATSHATRMAIGEQVSSLPNALRALPATTLFCGEGLNNMASELEQLWGIPDALAPHSSPTRTLTSLSTLGHTHLLAERSIDPITLQANYLRSPTLTKPKPPRRIE